MSLEARLSAFEAAEEPFLFWYRPCKDRGIYRVEFTRGGFISLARKAAGLLHGIGCGKGDRVLHCFGANEYEDLAFRMGAWMIGAVPVTVNWQADPLERVLYKRDIAGAHAIAFSPSFNADILDGLKTRCADVPFLNAAKLSKAEELQHFPALEDPTAGDGRMIIFTSGTTGTPKGVILTEGNYAVNRSTFEGMLGIRPQDKLGVLIVNPLHHANSTAICDWAIRRPGSRIHLIERYTTSYWDILCRVAEDGYDRIIAPAVSRHFDFLDELVTAGRLPVQLNRLKDAMSEVDFLIGSAPVGPKTIERLKTYAGRIPAVRFGSTETCLQVIGIPYDMTEEERLENFNRGKRHTVYGEPGAGYYIGRPHPPHNEVRIVRSIDRNSKDFMKEVPPGFPGYLITRGGNVMAGYVGDPVATQEAFEGEWYLGLKDICFALKSDRDGELDYFWMSRDSSLIIRGGANYACEQVETELRDFIAGEYGLTKESFDVAVVGIKVDSEHEDSCCVTVELKNETASAQQDMIEKTFLEKAGNKVSKGAQPDYLRFAEIPRNFKGAVLMPELKKAFLENKSPNAQG